jgi:hypothetical protein
MARPVAGRRSATAALPGWIRPQLTRLVYAAPEGPEWLHEIKSDDYRMHARLNRGAVRLLTRTGLDWTHKYPAIAKAVASLGGLSRRRIMRPLSGRHYVVQHDPGLVGHVQRGRAGESSFSTFCISTATTSARGR